MSTRDPDESSIHSFIVRIWIQEPDQENMPPTWYGQITLIATQEQHYFKDLGEMCGFFAAHLSRLNVDPGWGWQFNAKLDQFMLNVRRFIGKIYTVVE